LKKVVAVGKTVDDAIRNGLVQLGATVDQVRVRILEQPSKGLFGLIGSRDAKVELELIVADVAAAEAEDKAKQGADQAPLTQSPVQPVDSLDETFRFLNDVFEAMHIRVEMTKNQDSDHITINLSGDEIGILIGRRGQTLDALQYLTNIVHNRHSKSHTKIILDAENFRDRRRQTLEELSERLARKVVKTRKEVVLEPMSPLERKIIHSALQDHRYVKTYSKGEDPNRRVVIALK